MKPDSTGCADCRALRVTIAEQRKQIADLETKIAIGKENLLYEDPTGITARRRHLEQGQQLKSISSEELEEKVAATITRIDPVPVYELTFYEGRTRIVCPYLVDGKCNPDPE